MGRMPGWLKGAAAVVVLGVSGVAGLQSRWSGTVTQSLRAITPAPVPGTPIQAALLLQRRDCSGNLRVLSLLHRREVASRLSLAVLWFTGPASDSLAIRAALPAWTTRVPLRHVPSVVLRDLQRLGHRQTPVLMVLDHDGRIRLTTQTPQSPREFAGLRRIIEGLTWTEAL